MESMEQLVQMQCHLWDRDNHEMEALHRRKLFTRRKESSVKDLHLRRVLGRFYVITLIVINIIIKIYFYL